MVTMLSRWNWITAAATFCIIPVVLYATHFSWVSANAFEVFSLLFGILTLWRLRNSPRPVLHGLGQSEIDVV